MFSKLNFILRMFSLTLWLFSYFKLQCTTFLVLRDDSRSERRTRLGEGIEGRINVVSDETFRENNRALQEHKNKKDGMY